MNSRAVFALAAGLTATLTAALPARAQTETGNAILEACLPTAPPTEACMTYVAAIADAMRNGNAINGWSACPPPGLPARQGFDSAIAFMRWRGDLRHYSASAVVAHALAATYPCPRRQGG